VLVAEILTAIFTGAGVAATFLAVLVALFGPGWRERRRCPVLSLHFNPE
jgi:hypothetical protein